MEQKLLAYSLPKETVAAIMMLYKNTKVKVHSTDGDRLLWHFCRHSLRGYVSPILFHNLLWLCSLKGRSRQYSTQTIMNANYTDDIVLLANTPTQAESLLHSLKQAAGGIDRHVNADKTEYMYFNQRGNITQNGGSPKPVDKFTCLRSSASSTKNDINTWFVKVWTAIDRLGDS